MASFCLSNWIDTKIGMENDISTIALGGLKSPSPSEIDNGCAPCTEMGCKKTYKQANFLLEHINSKHRRDYKFICKHPDCSKEFYTVAKMTEHHTNKHTKLPTMCSCEATECRDDESIREQKVWACSACISLPFDSGKEWAAHYITGHEWPEDTDELDLSKLLWNLLRQKSTKQILEQLLDSHPDRKEFRSGWHLKWNMSFEGIEQLRECLEYGIFNNGSLQDHHIAEELVRYAIDSSTLRAASEPWFN